MSENTSLDGAIDFEAMLEPDDMPMCPFCADAVYEYERPIIIKAYLSFAIAHDNCVHSRTSESDGEAARKSK